MNESVKKEVFDKVDHIIENALKVQKGLLKNKLVIASYY